MSRDFSDTLVILGNGFDLSSGLKSRYSDYFKSRQEITSDVEDVWKLFKEKHGEVEKNVLDIINDLDTNEEINEDDNLYSYCYDMIFKLKTFYGFSFWEIPNIIETNDQTLWSDIERGILQYLKLFNSNYEELKNTMNSVISNAWEWNKVNLRDYKTINNSKQLFEFHMILANFLAQERQTLDSMDKKNSLCSILKRWNTFQDFFTNELNTFEHQFLQYIDLISQDEEYKTNRRIIFNELLIGDFPSDFDFNRISNEKYDCKVLSFNYTDYNDLVKQSENVVNIHGSVKSEKIIFGIDSIFSNKDKKDDYKYKSIDLKTFTKTYRLLELDSNPTSSNVLSDNIKTIKFFGHSLSHADYSYFQSIFDYYDIYSNSIKLIFYFALHDNDMVEEQQIMKRKRSQISKVYALMEDYGKTMDNHDHGKNLLHKLIMEGRLSVKRVKLPKELKEANN